MSPERRWSRGGILAVIGLSLLLMFCGAAGLLAMYISYAKKDIAKKGIGHLESLRVTRIRPDLRHVLVISLECDEWSLDRRSRIPPGNDITLFLYPWLESYLSSKQ
ncbi:MAG TPA: hypothetical protein VNM14_15725 [Planctomycetota bacterium]|nr:hypothetical protein [Planctomycetota bacterium]